MVCHYWYFNYGIKFKNSICDGCHDLTMLCPSFSDVTVITVKGNVYFCNVHHTAKYNEVHLLESSILDDYEHL